MRQMAELETPDGRRRGEWERGEGVKKCSYPEELSLKEAGVLPFLMLKPLINS